MESRNNQSCLMSRALGVLARCSCGMHVLPVMVGLALLFASPTLCFGQTTLSLGQAGNYAVLEAPGSGNIGLSGSTIWGNVGIDQSNYSSSQTTVHGNVDIASGITGSSSSTAVTGSVVTGANLSSAVTAADSAAKTAASWSSTAGTTESVSGSLYTFTGGPAENVVDVTKALSISGGTIEISGSSSEQFVFNISSAVSLSNTSIVLNGVSASNVFFNLLSGGSLSVSGGTIHGNILSLNGGTAGTAGTLSLSGVTLEGSVISDGSVTITNSVIVPEMPTSTMAGLALLLVLGKTGLDRLRRRRAVASTHPQC